MPGESDGKPVTTRPARAPFLSLCMIVKDEEQFLDQCLDSAAELVDEVVIYDTGSTDRTVDIAERRGATVIEGHWDDDFARARNAALRECSGTWILWLDADETLEGDPRALRDALKQTSRVDGFLVRILNVNAADGETEHLATRIFRRSRMHWVGQLHEDVLRRDGRSSTKVRIHQAQIVHHGYTPELMQERQKAERNLRIARESLRRAGSSADRGVQHINVARSCNLAGDPSQAIEHFALARELATGPHRAVALRFGAETLIQEGRFAEADQWIDDYEEVSGSPPMVSFLRGTLALSARNDGTILAELDPYEPLSDATGFVVSGAALEDRVARAYIACERWADAADLLRSILRARPRSGRWGDAVLAYWKSGADLDELVALLPPDELRSVVAQLMLLEGPARDAFAHAIVAELGPDHPHVFAFIVAHATHLETIDQMLPWATLIRGSRFDAPCPVLERARDVTAPATQRFLAAASAHAAFRDPEGLALLFEISDLLGPNDEAEAALILHEIAPDLIVT